MRNLTHEYLATLKDQRVLQAYELLSDVIVAGETSSVEFKLSCNIQQEVWQWLEIHGKV